jgi:hypothetical protein
VLRVDQAGVKLLVLLVGNHLSLAIARGDAALSPLESLSLLPVTMLLYGLPFVLYLTLVRSWAGTLAAGIGWIVVEVGVALAVAEESERSSTAGIGLVLMPPFLMLTVGSVALVEHVVRAGRGASR